ncbi:energy transducer TonB [Methylobacterium sp. P31]
MPSRSLTRRMAALVLLLVPWPAPAREASDPAVRGWLSNLVTRIDAVDRTARPTGSGRMAGTVVVRVEIAVDGSVQRAEIERSSGSRGLDQRALRAVQGISPFTAPPPALLDATGVANLSIPVELGR